MAQLLLNILDQKDSLENICFCLTDMQDWLNKKGFRASDSAAIKRVLQDEWKLEPSPNSNSYLQYRIGTDGTIYGSLIDFGMLYFYCSIKEFLQHLQIIPEPLNLSFFHQQFQQQKEQPLNENDAGEKKDNDEHKIVLLDTRTLHDRSLLDYLEKRCIPVDIASKFCKGVDFQL